MTKLLFSDMCTRLTQSQLGKGERSLLRWLFVATGCVWDVAFHRNGDLVTGCSDFVARIWTSDPARQAEEGVREAYKTSIAPKPQGENLSNTFSTKFEAPGHDQEEMK